MRWATRAGVHVDRAACVWSVHRFIDRGVELSHDGRDCTFETMLRRFGLDDPVLGRDPA